MAQSDSTDKSNELEELIKAATKEGVVDPLDEVAQFILTTGIKAGNCPTMSTQVWLKYCQWIGAERPKMKKQNFMIAFKKHFPRVWMPSPLQHRNGFMLNEEVFGLTQDDRFQLYKLLREQREQRKKKNKSKV